MAESAVPDVPGVTYRQLDWWTRRGWLQPDGAFRGSGRRRTWPPKELQVAELMGRLISGGLGAEVSARIAREWEGKSAGFKLAKGIYLLIGDNDIVAVVGLTAENKAEMNARTA